MADTAGEETRSLRKREFVSARYGFGLKVYTLAVGLLLFMAAIGFYSVQRVGQVNEELVDVAEYHLPLVNHTRHFHQLTERELLLFEKLLRADPGESKEAWQREFDDVGKQVGLLLERAVSLVEKGGRRASQNYDREQFARLATLFPIMREEHDAFRAKARQLLVDPEHAGQAPAVLRRRLEERLTSIRERMDAIIEALAEFTQVSSNDAADHQNRVFVYNLILIGLAAVFGILFAIQLTLQLLKPVRRLVRAAEEVEGGDLDHEVNPIPRDEIGDLTVAFNHMVAELKIRDRVKRVFGKYIDNRVVEELLEDETKLDQVERRVMTVSFCDLQGFTALGEQLTPEHTARLLNEYFEQASNAVLEHQGVIDKYIGDAVMAFWGPPFCGEDEHPELAARGALRQIELFEAMKARLPDILGIRKGLPEMNLRVGLCTGELVVGNLGSKQSKTYTVIGDTVNLASRLEGLNKEYGTNIIVSESMARELSCEEFALRELDRIRVKGKTEPVGIFELIGRADTTPPARKTIAKEFEEGLSHYRSREFDLARKCFEACARQSDPASEVFLRRIDLLLQEMPGEDWEGVWTFTTK